MKYNKITLKNINNYSNKFNKTKSNKIYKNVNTKIHFKNIILDSDYIQNKKQSFKNIINIKTDITNQENSGRCWLFAFLNIIRLPMIKKYKLESNFEFSQNYLFFYDKLEKANYFLNYIFDNKNVKLNNINNYKIEDLKLIYLLDNVTNDGGNWNIFSNLIQKYGLIPKTNMEDDFHSKNSEELNNFYNNFLRKSAKIIRESNKKRDILINEILEDCYKILTIFLGEPPKIFNWEYYSLNDKKQQQKYNIINNITPLNFYKKYIPYNIKNKVCLMNFPCNNIPYYKSYNIELNFNIDNFINSNYINVPIEIMNNVIKKSIDNNEAVWLGCDVDKYSSNSFGILDQKAFNYNDIFGFNNDMNKCEELIYRESKPTHALIIKGYNFKGNTNGYLIENSWGKDVGFNGNYYMSLEWFNQYAFIIVVDKKFLSKKELNVLKNKSITLPYWSPFGSVLNKKYI